MLLMNVWCLMKHVYVPVLISLQDLVKKLDEVTQNSEIVEIRQKESECELEAARDRVQQQATEILLKASKTLLSSGLLEMCATSTASKVKNVLLWRHGNIQFKYEEAK